VNPRLAAALVLVALAACSGPDPTHFDAGAYLFVVPNGWRAELDDDPTAEGQVNLSHGFGTVARIFRNSGEPESVREEVRRQSRDARRVANVIEVGGPFRVDGGVDGEEAWAFDATYRSGLAEQPPNTDRTIHFTHDGDRYVIGFTAPARSFEERLEDLDRILQSWDWTR
jgi:hypothetical protein